MEAKAKVIGTLAFIGETEVVGIKGFKKRACVIDTGGDWPQLLEIEMINKDVEKLNRFGIGQQVAIDVNLKGRVWTNASGVDKYFNSLQGWKIEAYNMEKSPNS